MDEKKAILAHPGLQTFTWSPNLAYFDTDKICRTCGKDFKFTKEDDIYRKWDKPEKVRFYEAMFRKKQR